MRPTSHVTAESDSSALTLESGDESVVVAPTPKGSVNTGTDAGTDYGEDEEVEVTASPGTFYFTLLPLTNPLVFLLSCADFLLAFFLSFSLSATFGEDSERGSWEGRKGQRSARARERRGFDSRSKEAETRVECRTLFDGRITKLTWPRTTQGRFGRALAITTNLVLRIWRFSESGYTMQAFPLHWQSI